MNPSAPALTAVSAVGQSGRLIIRSNVKADLRSHIVRTGLRTSTYAPHMPAVASSPRCRNLSPRPAAGVGRAAEATNPQ